MSATLEGGDAFKWFSREDLNLENDLRGFFVNNLAILRNNSKKKQKKLWHLKISLLNLIMNYLI